MVLLARLQNWLFRFGRDEALPIILTQRRIFILPTRGGLLFAISLGVMLIGAINYTLSLGHALVFLLTGLGLTGMVHTFRNLAGLAITPGHAPPTHAGEIARFPVHVANHRQEPRLALDFRFAANDSVVACIAPNDTTRVDIPCQAPKRGWLDPGRITLSTRYPLGLFRAWSYPHPPLSCLVYPAPIRRPLPAPMPIGDTGRKQADSGQEDFSGLRLRNPSDPPRHVAWKAVARSVDAYPLLVKQFSGSADEELWLDWDRAGSEDDVETRLSVLTGWVLAAEEAQLGYGLSLPGRRIAPGIGAAHQKACLEALALFGHEDSRRR